MDLLPDKSWFIEKHLVDLPDGYKAAITKLILSSEYACRHIVLLKKLLTEDPCQTLWTRADYFNNINALNLEVNLPSFQQALRQFRHYHFLRLLVLIYTEKATTAEILTAWSDCADAIILHALQYSEQGLVTRYGNPMTAKGTIAQLYTIAMGKLGGRELNFSSDIDLIFAFSEDGLTNGPAVCSNMEFFIKTVQQFIVIMQSITVDGFVFRVDLRLRPNGESGTLVYSLDAMENYYQEQGRDWERYAMVKGRVISTLLTEQQPWFEQLIIPFVYRRYVDFSVIESLRSMKAMIEREVQLNPLLNDIKRGQGGIREVEFIIQNFQLIRGGKMPLLRQQNALKALAALKENCLLPRSDALKQAYLFLRRLENCLQSLNDQQTHALPEDTIKQAQITLAMGFDRWSSLVKKLKQYQRIISHSFHSILQKEGEYGDEKRLLANQIASLWQGHVETSMAINWLTSMGFVKAEQCYQMINTFRHSPRCKRLSQGARLRLDRFMVLLLTELTTVAKTDEVLLHVLHLLENIVGRSAYLALLTENPHALQELLYLFARSPFITSLLVSYPFLLDALLNMQQSWQPATKKQLEKTLTEQLSHTQDRELQQDILRQFKLSNWLMVARAELNGACNAVRSGQFLSEVAEVIVKQTLLLASNQLAENSLELALMQEHFVIVAYGKLGSREMNYTSDLDLVFLHHAEPDAAVWVTRLTQKILHMLTTRTQSGILYTVDTRLRPSGAAGLLVSHVDAFIEYQRVHAWTWEHQALLKARIISGHARIKRHFQQLKKNVLQLPRIPAQLQQDVRDMRAKIMQFQPTDIIKQIPGGLLDLEFLIQFLVLLLGKPELARYTHTLCLLHQLYSAHMLTKIQSAQIRKAYKQYHYRLHQNILTGGTSNSDPLTEQVIAICEIIYAAGAG